MLSIPILLMAAAVTVPVCTTARSGEVCIVNLRWVQPGWNDSGPERITGELWNDTTETIGRMLLSFPLYDSKDRMVITSQAYLMAIPPGAHAVFNAAVEQPDGHGIMSVTIYTNRVLIEADGGSGELSIPILFTSGNVFVVRRYKKAHGIH